MLHARDRRHRRNHFGVQRACKTLRPRWTLFVWLVPHSSTLRYLARAPDSRGTDLGIPSDLRANSGCAQCVGNVFGKGHKQAREQARFAEKTSARIIEPDASRPLRPNALRRTIRISHGSSFRFGEKTGTVASALVLRRDAQDVWKRFYAGE